MSKELDITKLPYEVIVLITNLSKKVDQLENFIESKIENLDWCDEERTKTEKFLIETDNIIETDQVIAISKAFDHVRLQEYGAKLLCISMAMKKKSLRKKAA